MLSDPLRLGAFTCARWPEEHNRSDVSQNLLRHRTGPSPLLIQNSRQAKSIRLLYRNCLLPAATAADSSAARRESVVVAHNQLRLDLVDGVHGHAHDDQQR